MVTLHLIPLYAACLTSRYGFNDGDAPDWVLDWADAQPAEVKDLVYDADWKHVLRLLVRRHLIPAMREAGHTVEVFDIDTSHNPIRARVLDGVQVDHAGTDGIDWDERLDGLAALVPVEEIVQACRDVSRRLDGGEG